MKKHTLKKLSVFTLLAMLLSLLVSVPVSAATEAKNLIRDGEFEQAIGGSYWKYYSASGQTSNATTVAISPNEGIGNGSCLKIAGNVKCGAKYSISIPEEDLGKDKEYIFSVYCKATKGGIQYFPHIKVSRYYKDEAGATKQDDFEIVNNAETINVANQWIKVTKTIKVASKYTYFELFFRNSNGAQSADDYVLFDKVMLYKADEYPVHEKNLYTTYGEGFEDKQGDGVADSPANTAAAKWKTDTDANGNYLAHGGKTYLKLCNGTGEKQLSFPLGDSTVSDLSGHFRLSFWIKSSTTDPGTANGVALSKIVEVNSSGGENDSIALDGSGTFHYMTPKKANTWEKFTLYFKFRDAHNGKKIRMDIRIPAGVPGGTSVSVDDVVLTRVPESTLHGFGDLYDNYKYEVPNFSAGDIVSAVTYFVPETEGETGTMLSMLYEELNDGSIVLRDCKVKPLAAKGYYESEFTVPTEGKYFAKSCIWSIGENTISAMEDSILMTQQAS